MSDPQVTVLVPVYNGAAFLPLALDSALNQHFKSIEVLVVNDGSTDDSGAIADRYQQRHPEKIRVIHQANGGLVAARNTAMANARGEFFALLDADDVWLPHHLSSSVPLMQADPSLGLVHANIRRIDVNGKALGIPQRHWQAHTAAPWDAVFLRQEHVSCPTAVFRRSVLDSVGPFDSQFNKLGCEDRDLWLRIAAVSRVHYIDDVHADYRLHSGNMSKAVDKMFAARQRLIAKHSQTPRGAALHTRALVNLQQDTGDELRATRQFSKALSAYLQALRLAPGSALKPLKGIVKSILQRP